jgi:hypothetical protein
MTDVPIPYCRICQHNEGMLVPAEFLAPQSVDQGATVEWVLICASHADGWFEGADWSAAMYALVKWDEQAKQTLEKAQTMLAQVERETIELHARADAMLARAKGT